MELLNGMDCQNISNLTLSPSGQEAVKEIRLKASASKMLHTTLGTSVLATLFLGNGAIVSAWNISQFNWSIWAQAMRSIPHMLKYSIKVIAYREGLCSEISVEEKKFWKAVAGGCDV